MRKFNFEDPDFIQTSTSDQMIERRFYFSDKKFDKEFNPTEFREKMSETDQYIEFSCPPPKFLYFYRNGKFNRICLEKDEEE